MPKKILTIDDDPYIVKYITEVLSDNGYATCSASSVDIRGHPAWICHK